MLCLLGGFLDDESGIAKGVSRAVGGEGTL